ncbi:MAG TPA: hypothetical protein VFU76_00765 [Terriglobales bacterium]|nr:hypothetical protein [Terriglobales bacterium]
MNYGTTIDDLMTLVMRAEEHAHDTRCEAEPIIIPGRLLEPAMFMAAPEAWIGVA